MWVKPESKRRRGRRAAAAVAVICAAIPAAAVPASAAIHYEGPDGAPPASIGGYALAAWPAESRPDLTTTTTAAATTGTATFDRSVEIRTIGSTWYSGPWGGVYSGKVYWTLGSGPPLNITLSDPVDAIGFQAQSDFFGTFTMTATAQDGTTSGPVPVTTGGEDEAHFFGFYATAGDKISAITLTSEDYEGNDIAVGNFSSGTAAPDPDSDGDGVLDADDACPDVAATTADGCPYAFTGFFAPLGDAPASTGARAGRAIPVKFGLGGDEGLDILAPGQPASRPVDCGTGAPAGAAEETASAGGGGLVYDPESQRYGYVWKTETAWAGSCRELELVLTDGSRHTALVRFKR